MAMKIRKTKASSQVLEVLQFTVPDEKEYVAAIVATDRRNPSLPLGKVQKILVR
jgi:hypothetical protein